MRSVWLGILLSLAVANAIGQTRMNIQLKKELDSIYIQDQKFRELLSSTLLRTKADSLAKVFGVPAAQLLDYVMKQMTLVDSTNLVRIDQIVQQHGYPGVSLVGPGTNEAAFFVMQHAREVDRYLPIIKKAADQQELPFRLYAMMLDRSRMYNGKEQVYGTQGRGFEILNVQTGKKEFVRIIWPIENAGEVNKRRKEAGFTDTVEENAKRLGIDYKIFTLDDVKKMQSQ